ncbi:MAG: sugar ABC transporter ATP-binding protein [Caldilineales bacterium]|nr:sugar ABC transporter ATP-binding protein [Caldilineales bacterium]
MSEATPLLEMRGIAKAFPGVQALSDVSFTLHAGEIHALVGENGAGKSTLMNILTGAVPKDAGTILLRGQPVEITDPRRAIELGIAIIHQELTLIPHLTVAQNIYLGREPHGRLPGTVDWATLNRQAEDLLARLGLDLRPTTPVAELSIAQRQMVEVAKALSLNADIIAMDEPTSALSEREVETLFGFIRQLRRQGVGLIYISHRIAEVFALADRVTVLRDGRHVGTASVQDVDEAQIINWMVGRTLSELYPKTSRPQAEVVLKVEGLRRDNSLHDISFELHRGEILGLAGLVGAGRTHVVRALFGVDPVDGGTIWLEGRPVRITSPQEAIRLGIGLVPEDRKAQGLFLGMAVRQNITMTRLHDLSRLGVIDRRRQDGLARQYVEELRIRTPGLGQRVRALSGGNQQKVVIARWLTLNPKVLLLDEPTRGIDVGAKVEIYALMSELAARGVGILMISSELPEILGVCDRILVMRGGRLVGEFDRAEATQDAIMTLATGGTRS